MMTTVKEDSPQVRAVVVEQDPEIDPDNFMLSGIDTSKGPLFTVSEMAKVFFARTLHWVRWLEGNNRMMLTLPDGSQVEAGTRRNKFSARIYTLSDVEEVAHALAQNEAIDGRQLRNTLILVRTMAEMHHYLPIPGSSPNRDRKNRRLSQGRGKEKL